MGLRFTGEGSPGTPSCYIRIGRDQTKVAFNPTGNIKNVKVKPICIGDSKGNFNVVLNLLGFVDLLIEISLFSATNDFSNLRGI